VPESANKPTDPPRAPLVVDVERHDDEVVFTLTGELDPHTAPILRRAVDEVEANGPVSTLVFELSRLRFIDSSGLRVIISTHRLMAERGGRLVLRSPSATTERILVVTGLADQINVEH